MHVFEAQVETGRPRPRRRSGRHGLVEQGDDAARAQHLPAQRAESAQQAQQRRGQARAQGHEQQQAGGRQATLRGQQDAGGQYHRQVGRQGDEEQCIGNGGAACHVVGQRRQRMHRLAQRRHGGRGAVVGLERGDAVDVFQQRVVRGGVGGMPLPQDGVQPAEAAAIGPQGQRQQRQRGQRHAPVQREQPGRRQQRHRQAGDRVGQRMADHALQAIDVVHQGLLQGASPPVRGGQWQPAELAQQVGAQPRLDAEGGGVRGHIGGAEYGQARDGGQQQRAGQRRQRTGRRGRRGGQRHGHAVDQPVGQQFQRAGGDRQRHRQRQQRRFAARQPGQQAQVSAHGAPRCRPRAPGARPAAPWRHSRPLRRPGWRHSPRRPPRSRWRRSPPWRPPTSWPSGR
ncbi:Uncharacterised protein [Achromobacter sp. 2789STDY5608633]|nr:Uncharacterised protein [Achromobacter sp. 2789STDY5608633]